MFVCMEGTLLVLWMKYLIATDIGLIVISIYRILIVSNTIAHDALMTWILMDSGWQEYAQTCCHYTVYSVH